MSLIHPGKKSTEALAPQVHIFLFFLIPQKLSIICNQCAYSPSSIIDVIALLFYCSIGMCTFVLKTHYVRNRMLYVYSSNSWEKFCEKRGIINGTINTVYFLVIRNFHVSPTNLITINYNLMKSFILKKDADITLIIRPITFV